jgi:hypothetical protein
MSRKKLITEQYSDEVDLFKMAASYYKKHGMERPKKVLNKIMDTLEKRETPDRAPKDIFPGKHYIEEVKKKDVTCDNCGWSWDIKPEDKHPYLCHQCGHVNKKSESKEGAGAYDAPAYSMEPDHVHFKKVKNRF